MISSISNLELRFKIKSAKKKPHLFSLYKIEFLGPVDDSTVSKAVLEQVSV